MEAKRPRLMFTLLVMMLLLGNGLFAQKETTDINSRITQDLLVSDVDFLKRNLELGQPGLYNYTSKDEVDAFFEGVKGKITEDMSSIDFYRLLAPLSNLIKNGHTILVPSSEWEDYVITDASLLPLDLYFYEDQLYVLRNVSDENKLVEGSLVKSINGKSAMEIFNHMVERWFKDGHNRTRPREIVEEEYRLLYTHFFGDSKKYELEMVSPLGENQVFKVVGIQESEFKKRLKERFNTEFIPWWRRAPDPLSFDIIDGTAYLKVTQFSNGLKSESGERFAKFIKNTFKTIKEKGIDNLVLDLRGNQGGDVKPELELLKHLIKEPFHLYGEVFAKLRSLPNPEYYEFNVISRTEFKKNFVNEKVKGVYPMKDQPGFEDNPQSPSENLFKGNLYVLIDGWSFSATGEVCGKIKEHLKDAVFIGEETGGNPVTNISGIQTFLTLPHSKNRILICLVSYTTDVSYENDGHGVIPKHWVRNTVIDEIKKKDTALDFTLKLINRK